MELVCKIRKGVWLLVGLFAISIMVFTTLICIDIKSTTTDIREISSELTIEDMRSVLGVVEKQLDKDILALQLQQQRLDEPLEWSTANWQNYLNFCGEHGYVVSDYTWREYRYGRLVP